MCRVIKGFPPKYREYIYKRCLGGDYRNEYKQYVFRHLLAEDGCTKVKENEMMVLSSSFIVRDDLCMDIIENIFANLDLLAHKTMQKYHCNKKVAYSLVCYVFCLLYSENSIDLSEGFSQETFEIMESIFECGYRCENFDDSRFPSLKQNYEKYGRYYKEWFLENINSEIRKIYHTFNAEDIF